MQVPLELTRDGGENLPSGNATTNSESQRGQRNAISVQMGRTPFTLTAVPFTLTSFPAIGLVEKTLA